jgi:hypothetical protein
MKLYLLVDQKDDGGYTIEATKPTVQSATEWVNADPVRMDCFMCVVEAETPAQVYAFKPVKVQGQRFGDGKWNPVTEVFTLEQMKIFVEAEGKKHGYHALSEGYRRYFAYFAATKKDTEEIGGKFQSITFCPTEVELCDVPS